MVLVRCAEASSQIPNSYGQLSAHRTHSKYLTNCDVGTDVDDGNSCDAIARGSAVKRRFQDTKHDSNLFSFTFTRLATTLRTVNPILAAPILTATHPLSSRFIPTTICLRSELHTQFLPRYPSSSQVSTLPRP